MKFWLASVFFLAVNRCVLAAADGLLKVISQEWANEMDRIKLLGLNGYKRRKDSR
jgi:hypothetical protein